MGQDDMLAALAEVLTDVAYRSGAEDAAAVVKEIQTAGPGEGFAVPLDVTDVDSVDRGVSAVEDRFGLVIPDDEWAHFETVCDASAHVRRAAYLPR